jgi:hypothetical protein
MNADAVLSKIDAVVEFLFFRLVPLIALLPTHIWFVIWVEKTWYLEKAFSILLVAPCLTLFPLAGIAVIFADVLKRSWQSSPAQVIGIGVVLLFFGSIYSLASLQLPLRLRHENDVRAVNSLEGIYRVQQSHKAQKNTYATLQELVEEELILPSYLGKNGNQEYQFSASEITADTFCIHADRIESASGNRDYHLTETGEIRFIETRLKGTVPRGKGQILGQAQE